jgi:hypothetical protein
VSTLLSQEREIVPAAGPLREVQPAQRGRCTINPHSLLPALRPQGCAAPPALQIPLALSRERVYVGQ